MSTAQQTAGNPVNTESTPQTSTPRRDTDNGDHKRLPFPPLGSPTPSNHSSQLERSTDETELDVTSWARLAGVIGQVMGEHLSGDTGRALKEVGTCTGSNPDDTLRWLRAVDDVATTGVKPLTIAVKSAQAPLRTFIGEMKATDWPTLKSAIAKRFVSADFEGRQAAALQSMVQRPGESLEKFTHEFQQLVREAHTDPLTPEEDRKLAKRYLSALCDRDTALRIMRQHGATTLTTAIHHARAEQEVYDFLEPASRSHALIEEKQDPTATAIQELCQRMEAMTAAVTTKAAMDKPQLRLCYRCGKPGHFIRECRAGINLNPQAPSFQPAALKCERCRRIGHQTSACKTRNPSSPCRKCGGPHWTFDCTSETAPTSNSSNQEN